MGRVHKSVLTQEKLGMRGDVIVPDAHGNASDKAPSCWLLGLLIIGFSNEPASWIYL